MSEQMENNTLPEICEGSNGVREYIRRVARIAIEGEKAVQS